MTTQNRIVSLICAVVAAVVISLPVSAGPRPQSSAQTGGTAIDRHDLTGVWNALRGAYDTASFCKGDPPMTAWGEEQFKNAKPSQGPRGVTLDKTTDKVYQCYPPGMPYIYLQLFPMQIVQTPKEVIELFEYDHSVRHIFIDGRKHPADVTPTYNGDSIGHWEGVGHPDSDQMHITERIHRVDEKTLQVDFTFDDPKSYTKAWTATMRFRLHPDWNVIEDVCEDNRAFDSFEK